MVALPAVELSKNAVWPPSSPLTVATLLVKMPSAAVDVPPKSVLPLVPCLATNRAAVIDESAIGCGRAAGEHCGATPNV